MLTKSWWQDTRSTRVWGRWWGLLHWDMQAMMPPKGVERRTEQLTLLSGMMHKKLTSDRIGELLDMLKAGHNTLSEEERANVREMDRDYKKATKIPLELVEEMAREQAMGHEVWVKAREAADFGIFAPNLERMVKLAAEQAEYLGYGGRQRGEKTARRWTR